MSPEEKVSEVLNAQKQETLITYRRDALFAAAKIGALDAKQLVAEAETIYKWLIGTDTVVPRTS